MAFMVDMSCTCDAAFTIDVKDNEDAAWLLVWRFANAHADKCGFMTPSGAAPTETPSEAFERVRVIKATHADDETEDDDEEDDE